MKRVSWKHVLLLVVLLGALLLPVMSTFAQEGAAAEGEAAAQVEGEGEAAAEEAAVSPFVPLGINAGFLIFQILNVLIIFVLVRRYAWKPLVDMLDARTAKIQKGLEDAAVAANARKNAEAEAESIRAEARAEVVKAIEEGRTRGDDVRKQVIAEANTEAEKIRVEARAAAAAERDAQLAGLRGQIAAISMAATHRLIGSGLDDKRAHALIDEFFAAVPKGALNLGGDVEVVSAIPLSDGEQAQVKNATGAGSVKFTVDPGILGGLIVRSGERVVDGSVRSGLNDMAGRLA